MSNKLLKKSITEVKIKPDCIKYLDRLIGGGPLEDLQGKITYTQSHCINPGDIFHQHSGECWNDSMQMSLCFSDEIKSSVQQKLFNLTPKEIIDMAYLEGREKYLVPIYRRSSTDFVQNERAKKMEKRLEKYLLFLQISIDKLFLLAKLHILIYFF